MTSFEIGRNGEEVVLAKKKNTKKILKPAEVVRKHSHSIMKIENQWRQTNTKS